MDYTHPTPYTDLNIVLHELVTSAQAILGGNFTAAYLQGSLAGSDPDEHGDVDFVIVVEQPISEAVRAKLQAMHARLNDLDSRPAKHLEGSYFPKDVLRRLDPASEPVLYVDNGSRELIRDKHDDTQVVRWVLLDHGIALAGPEPRTLIDPVSADDLRREVVATMDRWARIIFADPGQMNNGWYQPYAALSYTRMLQTLHTGRVESKYAAVKWAKENLDARWADLVQRAWAERPNQYSKTSQPADPYDYTSTMEYIRFALSMRSRYASEEIMRAASGDRPTE
jgi:hypothetical protein